MAVDWTPDEPVLRTTEPRPCSQCRPNVLCGYHTALVSLKMSRNLDAFWTGGSMDPDEHDEENRCECVRVDVDQDDARFCTVHGPNSENLLRQREQDAEIEALYWKGASF